MKEPIYPSNKLRVVIGDITPLIHLNEPVSHRSVEIELTPEQMKCLSLRWTGSDGYGDKYEHVSMCFFEEKPTDGGRGNARD